MVWLKKKKLRFIKLNGAVIQYGVVDRTRTGGLLGHNQAL